MPQRRAASVSGIKIEVGTGVSAGTVGLTLAGCSPERDDNPVLIAQLTFGGALKRAVSRAASGKQDG
jgi:hypothetical protein